MNILIGIKETLKLLWQIAAAPIALQKWTHGTGWGPGFARIGQGIGLLAWAGVAMTAVVSGHPIRVLLVYLGICLFVVLVLVGAVVFLYPPGSKR